MFVHVMLYLTVKYKILQTLDFKFKIDFYPFIKSIFLKIDISICPELSIKSLCTKIDESNGNIDKLSENAEICGIKIKGQFNKTENL